MVQGITHCLHLRQKEESEFFKVFSAENLPCRVYGWMFFFL